MVIVVALHLIRVFITGASGFIGGKLAELSFLGVPALPSKKEVRVVIERAKGVLAQTEGLEMGRSFDRLVELLRVAPAGELGISIVVDHEALTAPQHDHRQGRSQHQLDSAAQAGGPVLDRAQFGATPIVRPDTPGHFTVPTGTPVTLG